MAPLIGINDDAVAEKPQSTENCFCCRSDIAPPGFLFYPDSPPFFQSFPATGREGEFGVAQ
jgi:hypothetical protein